MLVSGVDVWPHVGNTVFVIECDGTVKRAKYVGAKKKPSNAQAEHLFETKDSWFAISECYVSERVFKSKPEAYAKSLAAERAAIDKSIGRIQTIINSQTSDEDIEEDKVLKPDRPVKI